MLREHLLVALPEPHAHVILLKASLNTPVVQALLLSCSAYQTLTLLYKDNSRRHIDIWFSQLVTHTSVFPW